MSPTEQPIYDRINYFRGQYTPKHRLACNLIDSAPFIDVILIIFLFFIMNSSFVLQPGIKINLPTTPFLSGTKYGTMIVTLSQEDMVFFNDERTTLNGLASAFSQAHHQDPDGTLIIEADGRVSHDTLVGIYNMAIEVGIKEVVLATRSR